MDEIQELLDKLKIKQDGHFENGFYIIQLTDSDEYAKMFSQLSEVATCTEYPDFGTNTNKTTIRITNYFEINFKNVAYNIFLIADFENNNYCIKIGE